MTPFAPATASAIVATGLLAVDAGPYPPIDLQTVIRWSAEGDCNQGQHRGTDD